MTTNAAKQLYLAQHQYEIQNKGYAIYNPHNKPIEDLPIIYGFNNTIGHGAYWYSGELLAEDGEPLGGHACSHEGYMYHDLGILEGSRPDRHEDFRKHYPDGYRMDFVPASEVPGHQGLKKAMDLNQEQQK